MVEYHKVTYKVCDANLEKLQEQETLQFEIVNLFRCSRQLFAEKI